MEFTSVIEKEYNEFQQKFNYSLIKIKEENTLEQLFLDMVIDPVSHTITDIIVPNNNIMNKDISGNYYQDSEISFDGDVVTGFNYPSSDVKVEFVVLNKFLNITQDNILVSLCAPHTKVFTRFTYLSEPAELSFCYNTYKVSDELREELRKRAFCLSL
jgi:hypothetical protein